MSNGSKNEKRHQNQKKQTPSTPTPVSCGDTHKNPLPQ